MSFKIHPSCEIHPTAEINVKHGFIGARGKVGARAVIEGYQVEIGEEAWIDRDSWIGGGSCFDPCAYLKAGHWFHLGWHAHVNTARGVDIGYEVGLGMETKIFTHGYYLSELEGFPAQWGKVSIGNCVWLPNAMVTPGVTIGSHTVVASMSLVNKDLPANCLAAGTPAKILEEDCYPTRLGIKEEQLRIIEMIRQLDKLCESCIEYKFESPILFIGRTKFNWINKSIEGEVSEVTELVRNQLRRTGVRFFSYPHNGNYEQWRPGRGINDRRI